MLKALDRLQYGFGTPVSYESQVTRYRIEKLSLSVGTKLEPFHTGGVNTMDIDKVNDRLLVSGAKDGGLCIHDLQNTSGNLCYTAKLVGEVPRLSEESHEDSIQTVQWYPADNITFSSSGRDSDLKIWDANVMIPSEKFHVNRKINCHDISPFARGSLIAVAMDFPSVVFIDRRCKEALTDSSRGLVFYYRTKALASNINCIRWSPTCEVLLATGSVDSRILLWDIRFTKTFYCTLDQHNGSAGGNKYSVTAHNGVINGLHFTPDGLHLISCGTDNCVKLWDVSMCSHTSVNYGRIVNNKPRRLRYIDVCADTSPPVLFVPSDYNINMLDLFSGKRIHSLEGHINFVNCCIYRSNGKQLISGGKDKNILVWTPDIEQEIDETLLTQ